MNFVSFRSGTEAGYLNMTWRIKLTGRNKTMNITKNSNSSPWNNGFISHKELEQPSLKIMRYEYDRQTNCQPSYNIPLHNVTVEKCVNLLKSI